jgi:hypothetical protein
VARTVTGRSQPPANQRRLSSQSRTLTCGDRFQRPWRSQQVRLSDPDHRGTSAARARGTGRSTAVELDPLRRSQRLRRGSASRKAPRRAGRAPSLPILVVPTTDDVVGERPRTRGPQQRDDGRADHPRGRRTVLEPAPESRAPVDQGSVMVARSMLWSEGMIPCTSSEVGSKFVTILNSFTGSEFVAKIQSMLLPVLTRLLL